MEEYRIGTLVDQLKSGTERLSNSLDRFFESRDEVLKMVIQHEIIDAIDMAGDCIKELTRLYKSLDDEATEGQPNAPE